MKKKEEYIKIKNLSVSKVLYDFINEELLPGTKLSKNEFWSGFDKAVHDLSPKNKDLLDIKDNAFFSVNAVARKSNKDTPETNPYLIKFLKNIDWIPKKVAVFAGKIEYPKYNFFDKYAIKFIMWIT